MVDEKGHVVDIYPEFDVINMAAEKTCNNSDVSMTKPLQHRSRYFEGVLKGALHATLETMSSRWMAAELHRPVVMDEHAVVRDSYHRRMSCGPAAHRWREALSGGRGHWAGCPLTACPKLYEPQMEP